MDANAAARNAARQRWAEKDAKFRSDSLKFWNRETSAQRGMDRAATGYSRGISDDYQRALYVQGQARSAYQQGFIKYLKEKATVNEGGQARRRTTGVRALMRAKGKLEQATRSEFGAQMQRRYRGRLLKLQGTQASIRNKLGLTPEYGAPVLMPPSDRLSGALSIASQVIGIVSGIQGLGLGSSTAAGGLTSGSISSIGAGAGGVGAINSTLPSFVGGIGGLDPTFDGLLGTVSG